MSLENSLNAFNALFMFAAAVGPVYFAFKVDNPRLRVLSSLFAGFLILHGLYHLAGVPEEAFANFVSDAILEPLSYIVLLIFAFYYSRWGG